MQIHRKKKEDQKILTKKKKKNNNLIDKMKGDYRKLNNDL